MEKQKPHDFEARLERIEQRLLRLEKNKDSFSEAALKEAGAKRSHFGEGAGDHGIFDRNDRMENPHPSAFSSFFSWLKTDTLTKVGAFLLLLGAGWFVSYAFANNWIGPIGRISLGLLAGVLILGFGHLQIPKRSEVGQVLVATGGTMMLLTVFAAREIYDFFTPASSLGMMALVVVAMAVIAISNRTKAVAYLALLGGAVAPLLTNSSSPNEVALMSYIFILNIGVFLTVALRGWRGLIPAAVLITGAYSFSFEGMEDKMIWLFMGLFFIQLFGTVTAAMLHSKKSSASDVVASGMTGLLFLGWVFAYVPEEWASLILSGLVIVMLGVSYVFLKKEKLKEPLYIDGALGILFLGAATSMELNGAHLVMAFAVEAFLIVSLVSWMLKDARMAERVSFLQLIPAALSIRSIDSHVWHVTENPILFNKHFFALLIVTVSLLATAVLLQKQLQKTEKSHVPLMHIVLGTLIGFALIWLSSGVIFESGNVARSVSLVIYTVLGLGVFFRGVLKNAKNVRVFGGLILTAVISRLLLAEVWHMSLAPRIVTFVAIGILLISTAFFQKRHNQR